MSDLLEEREKALENKYIKDEEQHFRIEAKAIELFALWVANQLGYKNDTAIKYADNIMDMYVRKQSMTNIFSWVKNALILDGIETSQDRLERLFKVYQVKARKMAENS